MYSDIIKQINNFIEKYDPKNYINAMQSPEERRAKYALARELGLSPVEAYRFRDTHTPKIYRRLGMEVPPLAQRNESLARHGFIGGK